MTYICEENAALYRLLKLVEDAPGLTCMVRSLTRAMLTELDEMGVSDDIFDKDMSLKVASMVKCDVGKLGFVSYGLPVDITHEEILDQGNEMLPLKICSGDMDKCESLASVYSVYLKLSAMFGSPVYKDYDPRWLADARDMVKVLTNASGELKEVTENAVNELVTVLRNMTGDAGRMVLRAPVSQHDIGRAAMVAAIMVKTNTDIRVSWDPIMSRYGKIAKAGVAEEELDNSTNGEIWGTSSNTAIEIFNFTLDMVCSTFYDVSPGDTVDRKAAGFLKAIHTGTVDVLKDYKIYNLIIITQLAMGSKITSRAAEWYYTITEPRSIDAPPIINITTEMRKAYPASMVGMVERHNETLQSVKTNTAVETPASSSTENRWSETTDTGAATGGINSLLNKQARDPYNAPTQVPQQQWGNPPQQPQQWPTQQASWGQQPARQWPQGDQQWPQQPTQQQWVGQPQQPQQWPPQWPHGGIRR